MNLASNPCPGKSVSRKICAQENFHQVCNSVLKEASHKPSKVSPIQKHFFIQIYHYPEVFCNRHLAGFFEANTLKQVRILSSLSPQ